MGRYKLGNTICPTCDKELDTEQGVRLHHTKKHDIKLPNRVCDKCSTEFYDSKSRRNLCEDCTDGYRYSDSPEEISDEEWRSMSSYERWYYNNAESEVERVSENKRKRKQYVISEYMLDASCERCGFDDDRALEFHHTEENELDESPIQMARNMRSKSLIEKEFERGELICANCHLINHHPNRFGDYR